MSSVKILPSKLFMEVQAAHSYFPLVGARLDSQIYVELILYSSNWTSTFIEVPETVKQTR